MCRLRNLIIHFWKLTEPIINSFSDKLISVLVKKQNYEFKLEYFTNCYLCFPYSAHGPRLSYVYYVNGCNKAYVWPWHMNHRSSVPSPKTHEPVSTDPLYMFVTIVLQCRRNNKIEFFWQDHKDEDSIIKVDMEMNASVVVDQSIRFCVYKIWPD